MSGQQVRRRVWVEGRVQGVGFRWFTMSAARKAGVVGWVENCRDGRVVCEAQGDDAAVQALVDAASTGPPLARVDRVTVEEIALADLPEQQFDVRVTER